MCSVSQWTGGWSTLAWLVCEMHNRQLAECSLVDITTSHSHTCTHTHTHTQLGGAVTGPVNLGALLRKRVTHIFSTLRSRSLEYREKLIQEVRLAATVTTVHKESASFIKIVVNHEKKKKKTFVFLLSSCSSPLTYSPTSPVGL